MRNGAVLCDVVDCCISRSSQSRSKVANAKKPALGGVRSVLTISEARENIGRAFTVLRADHRVDLSYLSNHDAFMHDENGSMWGLYLDIKRKYEQDLVSLSDSGGKNEADFE